jgi:hypothetical protein
MKKSLKIFYIFALLIAIIVLPQISFAQIEPGLVDGWYIRDSKITKTTIAYVKEYLALNDKQHYDEIGYNDDVVIFKSNRPSQRDYPLEGMYVGKYKIENAEKLFIILGKTLYDFLKDRDKYDWELYEFPTVISECQIQGQNVNWWSSSKAQFSAFRCSFKVEKSWGFDGTLGLDQINYPWWYAGVFRAGFMHQRVRLGVQGPLTMGYPSSGLFRERLLNAGWGGYLSFNVDGFIGDFFFSDYNKQANEELKNIDTIYYLTFGGSIGYSFYVDISDFMPAALKISVGGEYHQVGQGHRKDEITKEIIKDKRHGTGGPFLRFDLTECEKASYEAFLQYANSSIMIGGAYNFTKAIGLEVRYSIIEPLRDREAWEQCNMFMISPRIRF